MKNKAPGALENYEENLGKLVKSIQGKAAPQCWSPRWNAKAESGMTL